MQSLFPTTSALSATFGHASPYNLHSKPATARGSTYQARSNLYSSWAVAEDAQQKAAQLSDAAAKELNKASQAAQAKTGKIELYSAKYYAAW